MVNQHLVIDYVEIHQRKEMRDRSKPATKYTQVSKSLSNLGSVFFLFFFQMFTVTKQISKSISEKDGIRYAVVDTPGIFDSDGEDYKHENNLIEYLRGCGGVNAFIVIHNASNPRLDSTFQPMLSNLNHMLGTGFWDHLIFVITRLKINMDGGDYDTDDEKDSEIWLSNFQMEVKSALKMKIQDFPVAIGVQNRNEKSYNTAIEQLLDQIPATKFMCSKLESPFDKDKVYVFISFVASATYNEGFTEHCIDKMPRAF